MRGPASAAVRLSGFTGGLLVCKMHRDSITSRCGLHAAQVGLRCELRFTVWPSACRRKIRLPHMERSRLVRSFALSWEMEMWNYSISTNMNQLSSCIDHATVRDGLNDHTDVNTHLWRLGLCRMDFPFSVWFESIFKKSNRLDSDFDSVQIHEKPRFRFESRNENSGVVRSGQ